MNVTNIADPGQLTRDADVALERIAAVRRIPRRRRPHAAETAHRRLAETSQGAFRRARRMGVVLAHLCGRL